MKYGKKKQFIKLIVDNGNVSSVCNHLKISRQTYYRWLEEDIEFKNECTRAMSMGIESMNDLAKGVIVNAMKQGDVSAAKYQLSHNDKHYFSPKTKDILQSMFGTEEGKVTKVTVEIVRGEDIKDQTIIADGLKLPQNDKLL